MNKVGCPAVGSWKEGRKEGRGEGNSYKEETSFETLLLD